MILMCVNVPFVTTVWCNLTQYLSDWHISYCTSPRTDCKGILRLAMKRLIMVIILMAGKMNFIRNIFSEVALTSLECLLMGHHPAY